MSTGPARPSSPPPSATARRELALALALLALGAFALLVSLSKPWAAESAALLEGATPQVDRAVSGSTVAPAAAAAGWVGFAAIAGLIATRSWGRVAVGAIVAVVGAAGSVSAAGAGAGAWGTLATAGCLLLVAAGLLIAIRGRRWPGLGSRYERSPDAASPPPGEGAGNARTAWDALDRGDDPTA